MASRDDRLETLIEPAVEAVDCRLWGVEFHAAGKHSVLRVYIDNEDGITVDDCERVSRQVSDVLDVEDPINGHYTLEVSSPGMDRILFRREQYAEAVGEQVDVRLHAPWEGSRHYTGVLAGLEGDDIVVQSGETEYLFPIEAVQRARVVPDFERPGKPGKGKA